MRRSPVERSHLARSWDGGLRVDTVIRINLHRTRSARRVRGSNTATEETKVRHRTRSDLWTLSPYRRSWAPDILRR
jgi:hypothetical protein